jgi:hypothetical protein
VALATSIVVADRRQLLSLLLASRRLRGSAALHECLPREVLDAEIPCGYIEMN